MFKAGRYAQILLMIVLAFTTSHLFASESFEMTSEGMLYVVRDSAGNIISTIRPTFDPTTGHYVVKDKEQRVIAYQSLPPEAAMEQIKIVTPVKGNTHSVTGKDFLGNTLPILRELPANDPRYQQLRDYINNDPGLRNIVAMQLEARNMKLESLRQQLNEGIRDPKLVQWLMNDLKKPIYLEVGNSGAIYHDPKGFILAERGNDGQIYYRDNSHANRLVIPPNSEAFQGGMNDSAAASVIAHEIGHMIMDQVYERVNYPKTNYAGPHSKNSITDEGFAYSEGWAEAIETLANKDRLNSGTSWRIQSQRNIVENKYIYKNHGVVDGPNDGILKTGAQMLCTEGVNATMFYKLLTDNHIQAPFSKVIKVFEATKPQTFREFIKDYIEMFPEDRSRVIQQFLESTKYATVDPSAGARYKELHDAKQAYLNAPSDNPTLKAQLEAEYRNKLNEYNQWKERLYQQTVVDGKIDRAISGDAALATSYSDDTAKQFRKIKLSETILKTQKALGAGLERAADSIKQSFSIKNVAMTAGTAIAMNLANQIFSGEKVSFKKAFNAIASMQFVGNVVGSSMGAAAGHVIAPLIQTFVPIPVVGSIAGMLLPTIGAIAGGQFGGNLGSGFSFKESLKRLDPVAIAGQAVGSTIGGMLGSMIPIPILGPMIGGIIGGWVGEKVFTGIAKLFGYEKKKQPIVQIPKTVPQGKQTQDINSSVQILAPPAADTTESIRIPPSIDRIPYEKMHPNLRRLKDEYEKAYRDYVQALSSGNSIEVKSKLNAFIAIRDRYRRALGAYIK